MSEQKYTLASLFPSVLLLTIIAILAYFYIFYVPTYKEGFYQLGVALPGITVMTLQVSDYFVHFWYLLTPLVLLAAIVPAFLKGKIKAVYATLAILGGVMLFSFGFFGIRLPVMASTPEARMVFEYFRSVYSARHKAERNFQKILVEVRRSPQVFRELYNNGGGPVVQPQDPFVAYLLGESQNQEMIPFLEQKLQEATPVLAEEGNDLDSYYPERVKHIGYLIVALHRLDGKVRIKPLQRFFTTESKSRLQGLARILAVQGQRLGFDILAELEEFYTLQSLTAWQMDKSSEPGEAWQKWWTAEKGPRQFASFEIYNILHSFSFYLDGPTDNTYLYDLEKAERMEKLLEQVRQLPQ